MADRRNYKAGPGRGHTLYKARYCEDIIDHMAQGLSKDSFAGKIRVSRKTLYKWIEVHEEFSEAVEAGEAASLLWHEKMINDNLVSKGGGVTLNAPITALVMVNRHGWRSKAKDEAPDTVVNNSNTVTTNIKDLSFEEKEKRIEELYAKRKAREVNK